MRRSGSGPRAGRRLAACAAIAGLMLSMLGAGSVAAAVTKLTLTTPYPAVSVAPGSKASFELTVTTDDVARVDLAISGVPSGWTATLTGGGYVVNAVQVDPKTPPMVRLDVKVPA